DILEKAVGSDVRDEQCNCANERCDFVAGKHSDSKQDRSDDESVRKRENENAAEVCLPQNRTPAFRLDPRHELGEKNASRNAENRNDGDDCSAEKAAEEKVETAKRRRKDDLVSVEMEIAGSRGVYESGSHQDGEEAHEGVVVLNDEWRIAIS